MKRDYEAYFQRCFGTPPRLRVHGLPAALGVEHEVPYVDFVQVRAAAADGSAAVYAAPGGRDLTDRHIRAIARRLGCSVQLWAPDEDKIRHNARGRTLVAAA